MERIESMPVPAQADASAGARDPLRIATHHYARKPMAAYFQSFELRAYVTVGAVLREPVLDLGCGDGTFGRMLCEALGSPARLTGVDLDAAAVQRARRASSDRYERLVCADSGRLPFETAAFNTVVANGSLGCGAGSKRGLDEVARILAPGGSLYCTVPTPRFERNYWVVRALEPIRLGGLARAYARRMNRRVTHFRQYEPAGWSRLLAAHGMPVNETVGFFPERLVTFWSVLAARIMGVHALLAMPPFDALAPLAGAAQRRLFGAAYRRTPVHSRPEHCAYILLHAQKPIALEQTHSRRDDEVMGPTDVVGWVGGTARA